MNLQEWRNTQLSDVTLPSGLTVTVKKVDLLTLVMEGSIPATLLTKAKDNAAGGKTATLDLSEVPELKGALDAYALATIVSPPIVPGAGDDEHLGLDELPGTDKLALFERANAGVNALAGFRQEAGQPDPG